MALSCFPTDLTVLENLDLYLNRNKDKHVLGGGKGSAVFSVSYLGGRGCGGTAFGMRL